MKLRGIRQTTTERFGPKLMRYCVMNSLIGSKPENRILRDIKSYSDVEIARSEKIRLGFGKSLSELQGLLSDKERLGDRYQRFMFPRDYTQRGNAHLWLDKIEPEVIDRHGLSDFADSSESSHGDTDSDGSLIKPTEKERPNHDAPGFESSSSDDNKSGSDSSPDSARKMLRAIWHK